MAAVRDVHANGPVRLARFAVGAAVLVSAATAVILVTVTAPDQCPYWRLPDAHATSLRLLFALWTLPIVAFNGFIVLRWRWVARKAIEAEPQPSNVPVTHVLVGMCLLGSAMSQLPLVLLIGGCTR